MSNKIDILPYILYIPVIIISLAMCYCLYRKKLLRALLLFILSVVVSFIHSSVLYTDEALCFVFFNGLVYIVSFFLIKTFFLRILLLIVFGIIPFFMPVIIMGPIAILYYSSLITSIVIMRDSVRMDVLTTLSNCMKQNMPLSTALAQAANGGKSKSARILRNTAQWLAEGYSLSDALKKSYRTCPGHIISLLAMAQEVDQLPQAAAYIELQLFEKKSTSSWISRSGYNLFFYPFILISTVVLMVCGLVIFVVPKFKSIFADMGSILPAPTRSLIRVVSYFFDDFAIGPFLVILLPVLILFAFFMQVFYPRRSDNPSIFMKVGDSIKWYCPGMRWFANLGSHIRVIEYFRMSLISGRSLDKIIANCASLDLNMYFRHKVKKWHDQVVSGVPVAQAARNSGMSQTLAWCFDSECGPGNIEEALTMLQKNYTASFEYRINLVKEYAMPISVLMCAALVGMVSYAIFVPLVDMIYLVMSNM